MVRVSWAKAQWYLVFHLYPALKDRAIKTLLNKSFRQILKLMWKICNWKPVTWIRSIPPRTNHVTGELLSWLQECRSRFPASSLHHWRTCIHPSKYG